MEANNARKNVVADDSRWLDRDILHFNEEFLTLGVLNSKFGILLRILLHFLQKVMQTIKAKQKCHTYLCGCYQAAIPIAVVKIRIGDWSDRKM